MELLSIAVSQEIRGPVIIERRRSKGLRVADISIGYLRFIEPAYIRELWYMLSEDRAPFLPIQFR